MNREYDPITLPKRHNLRPRLHTRPLLRHDELPALKVASGLRQQNRHLQRKHMLAIEILMQAIVVAGFVLEQKRRRFELAGSMTALEEILCSSG